MSSELTTKSIKAISRASIKLGDSFFTFEYGEERTVPDDFDGDIAEEKQKLWDTCNNEIDNQINETVQWIRSKGKL